MSAQKINESRNPAEQHWEDFIPHGAALGSAVWRAYCDRLHWVLIAEWCGGRKFRRALKTDVFDEAGFEFAPGAKFRVVVAYRGETVP